MNQKPSPANALKLIPKKWAALLVVVLVGYALVQPFANRRLGWSLPSLASLVGQEQTSPAASPSITPDKTTDQDVARVDAEDGGLDLRVPDPKADLSESSGLKYGLLREVGRQDFLSPGGLRYTSGSEEGHRLKHLERHLEDQPDRPGSHGVFYGDMPQVLRWLDDAYARGKAGAPGTHNQREADGRVVYEVSFDIPVGYVGGKVGASRRNPEAKRVRLVMDGDRVITAFPF